MGRQHLAKLGCRAGDAGLVGLSAARLVTRRARPVELAEAVRGHDVPSVGFDAAVPGPPDDKSRCLIAGESYPTNGDGTLAQPNSRAIRHGLPDDDDAPAAAYGAVGVPQRDRRARSADADPPYGFDGHRDTAIRRGEPRIALESGGEPFLTGIGLAV